MSTCRPLAGQRAWYDKGRRQRPFPFWILGRQPNQTVASSASPARSSVLLTLAPCLNHVRRSSSVLPACIHLDFATTPRGHRAAVAALAVLVRRDLLEVIAAKRHDAGVADLDEPIVIDKRSTRGTSACHLLGEGETERALLPADLEDAAGRHAEHEQGQEPPYEQEQERDEHEQARTLVGEDRHEGEDEREDEGHAVENNRQRLDGRPTQARLGHGPSTASETSMPSSSRRARRLSEHTPSRLIEQNFRSPSNRSILIICA